MSGIDKLIGQLKVGQKTKDEYIEVITELLHKCNKESVFILIKRLLEQQV